MAQINKPNQYFNTKLYTGNGSTQSITGVGFQPDWTWIKRRDGSAFHVVTDSVRGATKQIYPNDSQAEGTRAQGLQSFDSDGYTLGNEGDTNASSSSMASWNWLAGGTTPSKTYTVKVVSDSGNKYRFDDFGTSAVTLEISEGGTYTFDQADASNSGHPIRFSTTSDGSHGGGSEYTTGVTTNGTPGNAGAYTRITVAASAPTLYYYCTAHSGMGGQANTPTTNSFSSFGGSIQSNVSPNTTAGFSIVSYTGTGANATVGHGLSAVPKMIICKGRSFSTSAHWLTYHEAMGNTSALKLNEASAKGSTQYYWNNTSPTSSTFSLGAGTEANTSSATFIAYCFAEKKGYSKFSSYVGNGNSDGTFVYTGFKPTLVLVKASSATGTWHLQDSARNPSNIVNKSIYPNSSSVEETYDIMDFTSNGFKIRTTNTGINNDGQTNIYMAFAENPLVGTNNIPTTAR